MKYLQLFELFNKKPLDEDQDILDNIRDIYLELEDKGFIVSLDDDYKIANRFGDDDKSDFDPLTYIEVAIVKHDPEVQKFYYNDIKDVVDRSIEYMSDWSSELWSWNDEKSFKFTKKNNPNIKSKDGIELLSMDSVNYEPRYGFRIKFRR